MTNPKRTHRVVILLICIAVISCQAQIDNVRYRFTGTVEPDDGLVPIPSPSKLSEEIQADVGDQVSGVIGFPNPYPWAGGSFGRPDLFMRYGSHIEENNHMIIELNVNGHQLTTSWFIKAQVTNNSDIPTPKEDAEFFVTQGPITETFGDGFCCIYAEKAVPRGNSHGWGPFAGATRRSTYRGSQFYGYNFIRIG